MQIETDELVIKFKPSKYKKITKPNYIKFMDRLHFSDGDVWLVTNSNNNYVELKLLTKRNYQVEELLNKVAFIERAECFE